jgi:hypothetical protein
VPTSSYHFALTGFWVLVFMWLKVWLCVLTGLWVLRSCCPSYGCLYSPGCGCGCGCSCGQGMSVCPYWLVGIGVHVAQGRAVNSLACGCIGVLVLVLVFVGPKVCPKVWLCELNGL